MPTHKWDEGRYAKRMVDLKVFRQLVQLLGWGKQDRPLDVLSFPASGWEWERMYLEHFPKQPVTFFALEREPKVWRKMRQTATQLQRELRPRQHVLCAPCGTSLVQYLRHGCSVAFDLVYLDWMGTWSDDKHRELALLFHRRWLRADGLLRFTLGLSRGKPDRWSHLPSRLPPGFHMYDLRGLDTPLARWRTHTVPRLVLDLAAQKGYRLKPLPGFAYAASAQGPDRSQVPEASFLFQVQQAPA